MKRYRWVVMLTVLAMVFTACTTSADDEPDGAEGTANTEAGSDTGSGDDAAPAASGGAVLSAIQDRGELNCGVNETVPGFGFVDADGNYSGFDIDYCRAIAAAVFGDAEAVNYVPLTAQQRFTALQSGEIDVLSRNTTWTATRDGQEGATFATTTFYDGQGMMVRSDSGITDVDGLAGSAICVQSGTTTELNLATRMAGIDYEPLSFEENDAVQAAFLAGQCDGWTSDKSQLAGFRGTWPDAEGGPDAVTILDETFSKEPLGPVTNDGDSQWAQIVDWVVLVTITAEELGITQDNVGSFGDTEDANIRRLLGLEVDDGEGNMSVTDVGLGLDAGWPAAVIGAVGNYGEIFDRHIGPDTPLGLSRGLNALWTDGGLMYAPPYR